jgi:hypothetical protein
MPPARVTGPRAYSGQWRVGDSQATPTATPSSGLLLLDLVVLIEAPFIRRSSDDSIDYSCCIDRCGKLLLLARSGHGSS